MAKLTRTRHFKTRILSDADEVDFLRSQQYRRPRAFNNDPVTLPAPAAFRNADDARQFTAAAIDARGPEIADWMSLGQIPGKNEPLVKSIIVDVDDFGEGVTTGRVLTDRATGTVTDATGVRVRLVRKGDRFEVAASYPRVPIVRANIDDLVEAGDGLAEGGVYRLIDRTNGEVVRTGRTNSLTRRANEHLVDADLVDANGDPFRFETAVRTDVYEEQRGLEQVLHEAYTPRLNRAQPVSINDPQWLVYVDAADNRLAELANP